MNRIPYSQETRCRNWFALSIGLKSQRAKENLAYAESFAFHYPTCRLNCTDSSRTGGILVPTCAKQAKTSSGETAASVACGAPLQRFGLLPESRARDATAIQGVAGRSYDRGSDRSSLCQDTIDRRRTSRTFARELCARFRIGLAVFLRQLVCPKSGSSTVKSDCPRLMSTSI